LSSTTNVPTATLDKIGWAQKKKRGVRSQLIFHDLDSPFGSNPPPQDDNLSRQQDFLCPYLVSVIKSTHEFPRDVPKYAKNNLVNFEDFQIQDLYMSFMLGDLGPVDFLLMAL
jgi:hypothetical protein